MKPPKKLRFYARGESMVCNIEYLERGIRKFIGRRHDPLIGDPFNDPETGVAIHTGGFVPLHEPEEVPYRAEYVRECKAGCLWPADAETAALCGVPFDPTFGAPVAPEKATAKSRER
jgi:hypothetical protein